MLCAAPTSMKCFVALLATLVCLLQPAEALRRLRIVSPLQALTIVDPEVPKEADGQVATWRSRFLPKFKAGLKAEMAAREAIAKQPPPAIPGGAGKDWAARAQAAEQKRIQQEESAAEAAFDQAVAQVGKDQAEKDALMAKMQPKNQNQYQFVGVIQPPSKTAATPEPAAPITWYARKKPQNAKWSVRLVHVNKRAIIKDMFNQGKVDVFAKYQNTGTTDPETNKPIIAREYKIRNRSLRNLWNFSPKHFFTDSSGMYWRERRVRPGLYTDGENVYESSYRFKDGRNGMHKYSSYKDFVKSKSVEQKTKDRIGKRLKEDIPDLVVEE
uniref:Uncharacterized protein n=1 Tax=Entomoneis paludosa TaxID=265537 RepID=A0A7S2VDG3_9STRA|mmetsp:Transcript_17018/g.35180  ORF Transcript_17018/g.35180 Transcript_17018/m.35180 type:complete len:327 (+) Transcript_17018:77-1057(+)